MNLIVYQVDGVTLRNYLKCVCWGGILKLFSVIIIWMVVLVYYSEMVVYTQV